MGDDLIQWVLLLERIKGDGSHVTPFKLGRPLTHMFSLRPRCPEYSLCAPAVSLFFVMRWGSISVEVRLLTSPLSLRQMTHEWVRCISEMILTGADRTSRRKTFPSTILPTTNPTWASPVRSRRLTACAMSLPCLLTYYENVNVTKAKAVPLDATEAPGGRGSRAPTHSRPWQ
jgi:hypothetical protein